VAQASLAVCANTNCAVNLVLEVGSVIPKAPRLLDVAGQYEGNIYCTRCHNRLRMDRPLPTKDDCDLAKKRLLAQEHAGAVQCGNPNCSWTSAHGYVSHARETTGEDGMMFMQLTRYVAGSVRVCYPCFNHYRYWGEWRAKPECDESLHRLLVEAGGNNAPDVNTVPSDHDLYRARRVKTMGSAA
jgi:hypothetical protein